MGKRQILILTAACVTRCRQILQIGHTSSVSTWSRCRMSADVMAMHNRRYGQAACSEVKVHMKKGKTRIGDAVRRFYKQKRQVHT